MPPHSRGGKRPRFASLSPCSEGAGKTGCLLHPRSRVLFALSKRCTRAYRYSGSIPAFPAQWLYGLLRALPGERLFCLRYPKEASLLQNVMPAPRHQNHTTSPYASGVYVYRAISVHRISPHVRDVREAPLIRRETGGVMRLIWVQNGSGIFLICGIDMISENQKRFGCRASLSHSMDQLRYCEQSQAIHSSWIAHEAKSSIAIVRSPFLIISMRTTTNSIGSA